MVEACSIHENGEMFRKLWLVNLREDLSQGQTAVFKWFLEKEGLKILTGVIRFRIKPVTNICVYCLGQRVVSDTCKYKSDAHRTF